MNTGPPNNQRTILTGLISEALSIERSRQLDRMTVTIWDVGHGLCIWIKTPNGQNHWIDAGQNLDTEFSPAAHVRANYGVDHLHYLIISHPDKDHVEALPDVVRYIGYPDMLQMNHSLPNSEKYGQGQLQGYQEVLKDLETRYTNHVTWEASYQNPIHNGGILIKSGCLDFTVAGNKNNSSVVMAYLYGGYLFIFPGDIEPSGWTKFWANNASEFQPLLDAAKHVILVAPHHGRDTGYSQEMMDTLKPDLVVVCDKWGEGETARGYRENPNGLNLNGTVEKYKSTKPTGLI